ncbi:hypothetical protein [Paenibacillus sp. LPE1-1-1.1]|uniref:hypothetical protein n=1 Tax=Paenibacillus sp. LPE1-1-1.1 TaxID=3135230 RepID=UPI00342FB207
MKSRSSQTKAIRLLIVRKPIITVDHLKGEAAAVFERIFNPSGDLNEDNGDNFQPVDTTKSGFVWLPFRFDGKMAYLDWKEEWRIEDYE